jgi:integrase
LLSITYDEIDDFREQLYEDERGESVIRSILTTVKSSLSAAKRQNRITFNPAADIVLPAAEPADEPETWTAEETAYFLKYIGGDELEGVLKTIAYTGMRRSEAIGWRECDTQRPKRIARVERRITLSNKKLVEGPAKTQGWIGICPQLDEVLARQEMIRAQNKRIFRSDYQDNGLIFCREDGTPHSPRRVLYRFQKLSEDAGLKVITLHGLRHGAATMLINLGIPISLVSKFIRHRRVSTTVDTYGHLQPDVAVEVADELGKALAEATTALDTVEGQVTTTSRQHEPAENAERSSDEWEKE